MELFNQAVFALTNVEHARFYSVKHVADIVGVSTKTIRRWIDSGKLIAVRPGPRSMRIQGDAVAKLLGHENS